MKTKEPMDSKRNALVGRRYRDVKPISSSEISAVFTNSQSIHKKQNPLKSFLKRTSKLLPKVQDPSQRKAGRNLVAFLLIMLTLTFIARGASGAALPKVNTVSPKSGEIVESITGNGTVISSDGVSILGFEELTVQKVLVSGGQKIEPDAQLVKLSETEVKEKLARTKASIAEKEAKLSQLQESLPSNNISVRQAEQDLAWAEQDYAEMKKGSGSGARGDTESAQNDLNNAQAEAQSARAVLQELEDNPPTGWNPPVSSSSSELSSDSEPDKPESEPEVSPSPPPENDFSEYESKLNNARNRVIEADAAVSAAQAAVDKAMGGSDSGDESTLKDSYRKIQEKKLALESAKNAYEKERSTDRSTEKNNNAEAQTVQLDINNLKELQKRLETVVKTAYIVTAEIGGTITEIVKSGTKFEAGTIIAKISGKETDYDLELSLKKSEAEKLSIGNTAEVASSGGSVYYNPTVQGSISSISDPDEEGQCKVTIKLPKGDWKQGQSTRADIVKSRQNFNICIPTSALKSNNSGHFVLVVEPKSTILGTENILVSIPVTVKSTGGGECAIEGSLSPDQKLISTSTKPVEAGDRVRLEDSNEA